MYLCWVGFFCCFVFFSKPLWKNPEALSLNKPLQSLLKKPPASSVFTLSQCQVLDQSGTAEIYDDALKVGVTCLPYEYPEVGFVTGRYDFEISRLVKDSRR